VSTTSEGWPWWLALAVLGAYHGLNPAMGWLFAVALGLQEQRRSAVLQALPPVAVGHAAAVLVAVVAIGVAGMVVPFDVVRYVCGGALIVFGLYKLLRRRHPRWVGMRVGFRDLTWWSFLMASAHGAGLMLIPIVLRLSSSSGQEGAHAHTTHGGAIMSGSAGVIADLAVVGVHTSAMFVVMGLVAVVVYEKLGVMILKRTWINLDLVWAGALVAAGLITLVV
jgi:hypothetical protein